MLVALDSKGGPARFHARVASDGLPRTPSRIWVATLSVCSELPDRFEAPITNTENSERSGARVWSPWAPLALRRTPLLLARVLRDIGAALTFAIHAKPLTKFRLQDHIAPDLFAALPERANRSRLLRCPLRLVVVSSTEALLQLSGAHPQRLGAPSARDSVLLAQTNPWRLRE